MIWEILNSVQTQKYAKVRRVTARKTYFDEKAKKGQVKLSKQKQQHKKESWNITKEERTQ